MREQHISKDKKKIQYFQAVSYREEELNQTIFCNKTLDHSILLNECGTVFSPFMMFIYQYLLYIKLVNGQTLKVCMYKKVIGRKKMRQKFFKNH